MRGIVAFVGFPQTAMLYDRDARYTCTGHYNRLTASFKIGLKNLVGFVSKPLFNMSVNGFVVADNSGNPPCH